VVSVDSCRDVIVAVIFIPILHFNAFLSNALKRRATCCKCEDQTSPRPNRRRLVPAIEPRDAKKLQTPRFEIKQLLIQVRAEYSRLRGLMQMAGQSPGNARPKRTETSSKRRKEAQ